MFPRPPRSTLFPYTTLLRCDVGVRRLVGIASAAGGMEIEEVAATSPEKILQEVVDPVLGLQPYQGRHLAYGIDLPGDLVRPFASLTANLFRLFLEEDCTLAEDRKSVV